MVPMVKGYRTTGSRVEGEVAYLAASGPGLKAHGRPRRSFTSFPAAPIGVLGTLGGGLIGLLQNDIWLELRLTPKRQAGPCLGTAYFP